MTVFSDITAKITLAMVYPMFPGANRSNIDANLPRVLTALSAAGLGDKYMVLTALSTIRAETGSFKPVLEGISHWNTDPGRPYFNRYEGREDLGNTMPGDGARFPGRGFVQLTGRANYAEFGPIVGHDLIGSPGLANDPDIAAELLAAFIKAKEAKFRALLEPDEIDMAALRKLVNGGSHGQDDFASAFEIGDNLIPDA